MEEGKQENREMEVIEKVYIVFGDFEPGLLKNTSTQHFAYTRPLRSINQ